MTATFPIYPLARFKQSGQTTIKRPREFLYFSFDAQHDLKVFSNDSLRYYYPPFITSPGVNAPPVDLSSGFESWIRSDDSVDSHLDALLQTIQAHEEASLSGGEDSNPAVRQADIVTWRGMMTKIMTAPFDMFSDFEMNATCYQGTIYIEQNHEYKLAEERQNDSRPTRRGEAPQAMMQYWGYKFESLSVLDKPWAACTREEITTRDHNVVNTNSQYCSIVHTGIGSTSLVLAGEVDCVLGQKSESPNATHPWIELKTTAEPTADNMRERQKFERKMLRFWAQSFLLGVPKVVVGFRTADGFLTRMEEFETQKIPGMVARGHGTWNGNVCINFTSAFLAFLKQTIGNDSGVWRIKRVKDAGEITVSRIEDHGTGHILPPAFKAHREKMMAAEIARKLG